MRVVTHRVTVDASNTVTLTSLLDKSCQCYWNQPNGRSQGRKVKLRLPFQCEYEVTGHFTIESLFAIPQF